MTFSINFLLFIDFRHIIDCTHSLQLTGKILKHPSMLSTFSTRVLLVPVNLIYKAVLYFILLNLFNYESTLQILDMECFRFNITPKRYAENLCRQFEIPVIKLYLIICILCLKNLLRNDV